jgi:hypothetical protein
MSSSASSIRTLTAATSRWSLAPTWRSSIVTVQSSPCPAPTSSSTAAILKADGMTREQLLEQIQLDRMKAEERIARLKAESENPQAAAGESSSDEEEDAAAADRGDEKHDAPVKPPGVETEKEDGEDDDSDEEGDYDNELEYYVYEILCLDAINHDPPAGKEVACTYCKDGKKFESESACATCAYVRVSQRNHSDFDVPSSTTGTLMLISFLLACCSLSAFAFSARDQGVCASCRKVVVLKSLEDPAKGAAICLALLTDEALLQRTLEIEDDADGREELEAVREQIVFMLDAYFDKQ